MAPAVGGWHGAAAPENSPAIYGWVHGSGMFQVPPGTKDPCGWPPLRTATLFFCRPSRDFYLCLTRYPAMNGWAIVIASLHNFVACAPACLGLRGQAPRDPAFVRTKTYRINYIPRPPESAVPSAVRRDLFVEPQTKIYSSPVGAASSGLCRRPP